MTHPGLDEVRVESESVDASHDARLSHIRFSGCLPRLVPQTWAQKELFNDLEFLADDAAITNLRGAITLPANIADDAIVEALRRLTIEHEGLRTLYFRRDGQAMQEILGAGSAPLYDFRDLRPSQGEQQTDQLAGAIFDIAGELPVKWTLTSWRNDTVTLGFIISHVSADGLGLRALEAHLRDAVAGVVSPTRWAQPADLAVFETSEAGQAMNRRNLDAWWAAHKSARLQPRAIVRGSGGRFVDGRITSPKLSEALAALRRATSYASPPLAVAAVALALGEELQASAIPVDVMFHNRIRPDTANSVVNLAQISGRLAVATVEGDLLATAAHAQLALLGAYRRGRLDPDPLRPTTWVSLDAPSVVPVVTFNYAEREEGRPAHAVCPHCVPVPFWIDEHARDRVGLFQVVVREGVHCTMLFARVDTWCIERDMAQRVLERAVDLLGKAACLE